MTADPTLPLDGETAASAGFWTMGRLAGILAGPGILALTVLLPPPPGLSGDGWFVVGLAGLMALWWALETVPVPVTALVPLLVLPLGGILSLEKTAAPYANPLVFLFLGGFLIARALERWRLHRRIALAVALRMGTRPDRLVLGFMVAAAILSMWVSNTATAVMMVPIAASVIAVVGIGGEGSPIRRDFGVAMMLGVAFGASIGGMATLIGSPPNAFLAGFMGQPPFQIQVTFLSWLLVALPVSVILLPITWVLLTRVACPRVRDAEALTAGERGRRIVRDEYDALGPMSPAERRVGLIAGLVALAWVFEPALIALPGLERISDVSLGLLGALALFLVPAGEGEEARGRPLLTWSEAVGLPWGVLLLFGGGLSLAAAIAGTDLAAWLGESLSRIGTWPLLAVSAIIALLVALLTNLASNTAVTAAFLPVVAALAQASGMAPMMLAVPAALAASAAFVLPVATPPNAVVFASGQVRMADMVRAGLMVNAAALIVVVLVSRFLVPLVFPA